MDLTKKSVTLVGLGESNKALYSHLSKNGIVPSIRNKEPISVPLGAHLITDNYLNVCEDVCFRSPVIRPDRIRTNGTVTTEVAYALGITRGKKIGVTGSDGKTTTSTLIYKMLEADGKDATLCGNIGTPCIEYAEESTDKSYTVCELSSFQLMDMTPDLELGIITNISENHLDWHTSMREYVEAKAHILMNARISLLNLDNPYTKEMITLTKPCVLFSGQDLSLARIDAHHLVYIKQNAIWCDGVRVIALDKIRMRGKFNISNAQCAIGALWDYVSHDAIEGTLRTFSGVSGRMEKIAEINGVTFISSSIDSTPSRTIATLSAMDKPKCILILGGYDKGVSYAPLADATRGIKLAVLCGANSDKIEREIKNSAPILRAHTLNEATRLAYNNASEGDTVLLSPASASFDMFKNYIDRENEFKKGVNSLNG